MVALRRVLMMRRLWRPWCWVAHHPWRVSYLSYDGPEPFGTPNRICWICRRCGLKEEKLYVEGMRITAEQWSGNV
jgi:hypothetical protein